jgi:hypothetical protein
MQKWRRVRNAVDLYAKMCDSCGSFELRDADSVASEQNCCVFFCCGSCHTTAALLSCYWLVVSI